MPRFRSLSIRFIVTAVLATAVTFSLFLALVIQQLDRNLARQASELERLTDANLSRRLDADVALATARLRFQNDDTLRRIQSVSMRADTVAALQSRNMVAVEAVLDPASRVAEVNAVIAVDASANVIGASIRNADLVELDRILRAGGLRERIASAISESQRTNPKTFAILAPTYPMGDLQGSVPDGFAEIAMAPVFDDFGDVIGGLVAQRPLKVSEPILREFARITGSGVAVYAGDTLISSAGVPPGMQFDRLGGRLLAKAGNDEFIARCAPAISPLTLCAFKPIDELFAAQNELTRIGKREGRKLIQWLLAMGVFSAVGMSAAIATTALPITRPLRKLAAVVSSVARGHYDVSVEHTERADEIGEISSAVLVLRDSVRERDNLRISIVDKNTELERQELELRHQNLLFDAALNNMSHGLCMFDAEKRLIVANRRYREIFQIDPRALHSKPHIDALQKLQILVSHREWTGDEAGGASDPLEWPVHQRSSITEHLTDGRIVLTTRQPLAGGGWVVIYEDVTERQKARDRLAYQAKHDSLTELPNRVRLREQLTVRLEQLRLYEQSSFAVFCIDLDEFKSVNDTLGHSTGDHLLQQVANRLLQCAGGDHLVVRLGGDEFAVVTPVSPISNSPELPQQIIQAIGAPYVLQGHEVVIGASLGIAIAPHDGANPDEIMKNADLALYRAKAEGRNTYRYFRPEMAENARERQQLIHDLRGAIEAGELAVYFQPLVAFEDSSISGFEALVRWQHPTKGIISPGDFIPIAEDTGLIIPIGDWVLRESCRHAALWPIPVRLAVNISARQLRTKGFVGNVVNALAATGLPATRLELEITESVLLQDDDETRSTLLQLKALGIKIAMDDFGTGYSSLSCLRSFPFDKIKIDQSFVRAMTDSDEASSIVTAIVDLADNLNIDTTAEGIEDQATLDLLKRKGCTEGQGYYLGRPQPAHVANELLSRPVQISSARQLRRA